MSDPGQQNLAWRRVLSHTRLANQSLFVGALQSDADLGMLSTIELLAFRPWALFLYDRSSFLFGEMGGFPHLCGSRMSILGFGRH
jgi:hypothetical protein